MTRPFASALLCVALVSVGSCGGDDDEGGGASCGAFNACGGTIQPGTYKITSSCMESAKAAFEDLMGCTTATIEVDDFKASGTLALNADMTYTSSITSSASTKITIPASCLMIGGLQLTCAQLQMQAQAAAANDPDSNLKSLTCTGSSTCTCTAVGEDEMADDAGRWATAGNLLTMTPTGEATGDALEYCAQGSTLRLNLGDSAMTMPMMGEVALKASVTLKKQ